MPRPANWLISEWNLFQLARWMGVPPWELVEQAPFWMERGRFFMEVEDGVTRAKSERLGKNNG
jgi:hypothetical protein